MADGLSVVPAGNPAAIRRATLEDGRVEDFLALVDERFDLAILDCEPITEIGDAAALSPFVDGFVVVIAPSAPGAPWRSGRWPTSRPPAARRSASSSTAPAADPEMAVPVARMRRPFLQEQRRGECGFGVPV